MLSQQVLRAGIMDVLGIADISTDIADITTDIADVVNIADITTDIADVVNIAVKTGRYI